MNYCQKKKLRHLLGRNKYTLKNKKILKQVLKNIARILFYIVILFTAQVSNVFAADDPLAVVNNLSNFIFGLIRAVGMIILGFGVVQVGYEFEITRSQSASKWNNDSSRWNCNHICKRNFKYNNRWITRASL